jgi:hypothetical protein
MHVLLSPRITRQQRKAVEFRGHLLSYVLMWQQLILRGPYMSHYRVVVSLYQDLSNDYGDRLVHPLAGGSELLLSAVQYMLNLGK